MPHTLDVDVHVPPGAVESFAALQDALDLAERLATSGSLLARPGLPEIIAVRHWACEQVLALTAGAPAAAWPGTDHERFLGRDDAKDDRWDDERPDVAVVRSATQPVVAAGDSNLTLLNLVRTPSFS